MMSRLSKTVLAGSAAVLLAALIGPVDDAPAAPNAGKAASSKLAPLAVSAAKAVTTARPARSQGNADVAWNGKYFFVVWNEANAVGRTQVWGARVTKTGNVLDPNGILLATDEFNDNTVPTVAGGPGRFLIAWEIDIEGTYSDLGAAMVNNAGAITRQWGLSFGDNGQSVPVANWNGKLFVVAWQDEPDADNEEIYGTRVTLDGLTLDGCSTDSCPSGDDTGIPIVVDPTADQVDPAIASNADVWVVPYSDRNAATPNDIGSSAVAVQGSAVIPGGWPLSEAAGSQTAPSVARNGEVFLVAWTDTRDGAASNIYATRTKPGDEVNYDPTALDPNGIAVSTAAGIQSQVSVTNRGTGFLATWSDQRGGGQNIFGSRVTAGGVVQDPTGAPIANTALAESDPDAATGGGVQLVTYTRVVGGVARIAFRLVS